MQTDTNQEVLTGCSDRQRLRVWNGYLKVAKMLKLGCYVLQLYNILTIQTETRIYTILTILERNTKS